MMIENTDQRSKDYGEIARQYRPGHADYTYDVKYGIRDYRGGGRSSARETAARVAAGAIARKIVPGLEVKGALVAMGVHGIDRRRWNWSEVDNNPFFSPDAGSVELFADYLDGIRRQGSSVGAVIEIVAEGVPAGIGAPIYGKLDQDIASLPVKKMPTKCAWAMTASRCSCPIMQAVFSVALRPVRRLWRALRSSRPRLS
jgi:chorismate synthase